MTFLKDIFALVLSILQDIIITDLFMSICWMFILVLIALFLYKIWEEVFG